MADVQSVTDRLLRRLSLLGLVSTAGGLAVAAWGRTPSQRAFGGQSAGWGAVDLGIAAVGLARRSRPTTARRLRRVLLVNTGLDVVYVAAGVWLVARAPALRGRLTPEQARGHGAAVVLQGLALLALDAAHARELTPGPTTRGA